MAYRIRIFGGLVEAVKVGDGFYGIIQLFSVVECFLWLRRIFFSVC